MGSRYLFGRLIVGVIAVHYVFKAMRFNPPRKLSMMITLLQLSQMAIGLFVNFYAVYVKGKI